MFLCVLFEFNIIIVSESAQYHIATDIINKIVDTFVNTINITDLCSLFCVYVYVYY